MGVNIEKAMTIAAACEALGMELKLEKTESPQPFKKKARSRTPVSARIVIDATARGSSQQLMDHTSVIINTGGHTSNIFPPHNNFEVTANVC